MAAAGSGRQRSGNLAQMRWMGVANLHLIHELLTMHWLLTVEDARETHEGGGGAGRALFRAVPDAMAVFAEVRTGQGHVLHRHEGHIVTPIIAALNVKAHVGIPDG